MTGLGCVTEVARPGSSCGEGLTVSDLDEAALKRILVSRAADTYVLASLEKIGTVAPYTVTGLSNVAGIVTDAPSDHPTIQQLRHQGINVIQAP